MTEAILLKTTVHSRNVENVWVRDTKEHWTNELKKIEEWSNKKSNNVTEVTAYILNVYNENAETLQKARKFLETSKNGETFVKTGASNWHIDIRNENNQFLGHLWSNIDRQYDCIIEPFNLKGAYKHV